MEVLDNGRKEVHIINVPPWYYGDYYGKAKSTAIKNPIFDDTDHLKLKEIAEKEDRSLTYVVNQAIKQFYKAKRVRKHEI